MRHLKDFCALIFSGVTLHNGLTTNQGMVAVYGDGPFARTLYQYETINSKEDIEYMLRKDSTIQLKTLEFFENPTYAKVCVSPDVESERFIRYLLRRGFKESVKEDEIAASSMFENNKPSTSKVYPFGQYSHGNIAKMGRRIAAAVSVGHVRLSGNHWCLSGKKNRAPREIVMNTPLDLGTLKIKVKIHDIEPLLMLVYINGNFRILKRDLRYEWAKEKEPLFWGIYPKFDTSENMGLMDRQSFDIFLDVAKNNARKVREDSNESVLIGCNNRDAYLM